MKVNDDHVTPVEDRPGILAHIWDGEFYPIQKSTSVLEELTDWALSECLEYGELEKTLKLSISGEEITITLEPWSIIEDALLALPAFDVVYDPGHPDQGLASGSGYLIFLNDGFELKEAENQINQLVEKVRPLVLKAKELQQIAASKIDLVE